MSLIYPCGKSFSKTFDITNPYPNPFNPSTKINISIPFSGNVNISIYDINGNLVEELHDSFLSSGQHIVDWNAANHSSGIYFINISYQNNIITKKAILMK